MKNIAIILASGKGERTGLDVPKQFIKIAGKTVIEHTIEVFEKNNKTDEIIIVSNPDYITKMQDLIIKNNYSKVKKVLAGGDTRRESSRIGINSVEYENAKVLIHDAVRPFLNDGIIDECINQLDNYKAVDVVTDSPDTLVRVNDNDIIEEIPKRKYIKRGQTPQGFDLKTIKKAHEIADKTENIEVTDDCGLILKFNLCEVYTVKGDNFNRKITYPLDVAIADKLFWLKSTEQVQCDNLDLKNKTLVIFGSGKGIGKATLDLALKYNAEVFGYSKSTGVDIRDIESVKAALEDVRKKSGKIDYIVNTAGLLKMGQLCCRDFNDIYDEISTNYLGCVNIARLSYEYLKETKGGLVFFTSSSYTRGRALYSVYSSSKAAVVNLVQALAEEWIKDDIKINAINPERTATPMRFENFGKEPGDSLLEPETVAKTTLSVLLSNRTGQVIDIKRTEKN